MRVSRKRKDKRKEEALTGIGLAQPVARVQGDFRRKTTGKVFTAGALSHGRCRLDANSRRAMGGVERAIQSSRVLLLAHHVNGPTGQPLRAIARSSQRLRPDPTAIDEPRCAP